MGAYDEDGELTGFTPANMVCGQGEIEGRAAVVQGDDFTVRGGAADAAIWQKMAGASHGDHSRLNLRYAWPSGDWGSLPIAGGLEAAYRRELEAAEDPVALRAEIEARLDAVRSPFRTAERFGVEEIIDPRDTRPLLCAWARQAHRVVAHEAGSGPKSRGPRP